MRGDCSGMSSPFINFSHPPIHPFTAAMAWLSELSKVRAGCCAVWAAVEGSFKAWVRAPWGVTRWQHPGRMTGVEVNSSKQSYWVGEERTKGGQKVGRRDQCDRGHEGVSGGRRAKLFLNKTRIMGMEMQMQEIHQWTAEPSEDKTVARVNSLRRDYLGAGSSMETHRT